MFGSDLSGICSCHFLVNILIDHITFIACNHDRSTRQILLEFRLPLFDLLKTVLVSDIVNQQSSFTLTVVGYIECVVALLTRSVPDCEADLGLSVNLNFFLIKSCVDSRLLLLIEFTTTVLDGKGGLSHSSYSRRNC
jgi:hypothetical protein